VTGDRSVWGEVAPYLHAAPLEPHQDERYELPTVSSLEETVYQHCLRAVDNAFRFGAHGLPLMGTGDWNDGMNKIGAEGAGESVWMAWFLAVVLRRMIPWVEEYGGDRDRAAAYRTEIKRLLAAVEEHCWDGAWYRRAYFDDGTPLGSRVNDECRIDSLSQTWSVIAGGDRERSALAMQSVEEFLIRRDNRVILLLDPPFDKTELDPGYIKGYLPGIRENGGQYTHAALWVIQAFAMLGQGSKAAALYDLINPILHAADGRASTYRVEPFVVVADVYGRDPHLGRGGWTWYTGSASWMYRVAVESILGLDVRGDALRIEPCIPKEWPHFQLALRRGATTWNARVDNPNHVERGVVEVVVDGKRMEDRVIRLADDQKSHEVRIVLG
jgi:cellobiose phosphorylase